MTEDESYFAVRVKSPKSYNRRLLGILINNIIFFLLVIIFFSLSMKRIDIRFYAVLLIPFIITYIQGAINISTYLLSVVVKDGVVYVEFLNRNNIKEICISVADAGVVFDRIPGKTIRYKFKIRKKGEKYFTQRENSEWTKEKLKSIFDYLKKINPSAVEGEPVNLFPLL